MTKSTSKPSPTLNPIPLTLANTNVASLNQKTLADVYHAANKKSEQSCTIINRRCLACLTKVIKQQYDHPLQEGTSAWPLRNIRDAYKNQSLHGHHGYVRPVSSNKSSPAKTETPDIFKRHKNAEHAFI